jgi:hypothetical protein
MNSSFPAPGTYTNLEVKSEMSKLCNKKLCNCPKFDLPYFLNIETGEIVKGSCKTYACEYCGPRKARKLQNALQTYFQRFSYIRFWTFTFSSEVFKNTPGKNYFKLSAEIWRRFLNNLRRSSELSAHQAKVQYVKVLELHKSGIPHFHVFFDRWIPRCVINKIWQDAIFTCSEFPSQTGNAYVEGMTTARKASSYITKYLMKTVRELSQVLKCRVWSKSNRVPLFEKSVKKKVWLMFKTEADLLYLSSLRVTSRIFFEVENEKENYCSILRPS